MRARFVLALNVLAGALLVGVFSSLVSAGGGAAVFCPFTATRTPNVINATTTSLGNYVCVNDAVLNVTTPSGVSVQYTKLSCASGVLQFNVTFTDTGRYTFQLFSPTVPFSLANCTTTFYAPTKRTVPDSNPYVALVVALGAGAFVALQSGKRSSRSGKPKAT